ncbi:hypothetical protein AB0K00_45000, partial [Dactylosporangium sp. NPDC049525]|uniref:hypothetical protein n=1 Tax=Dactylosporangium sp. NPDC049525 TaxID=3154730 RepID=UPI0034219F8B
ADGAAPAVPSGRVLRGGGGRRPRRRDWRDDALAAEAAGDLKRAAEIHQSHHDLIRAAHLYERAAREQ